MIRTGDTIHNPVTGERITFLATSADTDGEAVVIEVLVQQSRQCEPDAGSILLGSCVPRREILAYVYRLCGSVPALP